MDISAAIMIVALLVYLFLWYRIRVDHRRIVDIRRKLSEKLSILEEDKAQLLLAIHKIQYGSEGSMSKNKSDIALKAINRHAELRKKIDDLNKE